MALLCLVAHKVRLISLGLVMMDRISYNPSLITNNEIQPLYIMALKSFPFDVAAPISLGFTVSRAAIEADIYGDLDPYVKRLANSMNASIRQRYEDKMQGINKNQKPAYKVGPAIDLAAEELKEGELVYRCVGCGKIVPTRCMYDHYCNYNKQEEIKMQLSDEEKLVIDAMVQNEESVGTMVFVLMNTNSSTSAYSAAQRYLQVKNTRKLINDYIEEGE